MRKNTLFLRSIHADTCRYGVLLILVFCLMALAACGGSSSGNNPPASQAGNLTVSVNGLPNGTAAAISVTGPNSYRNDFSATATLQGLAPGAYTVSASNVVSSAGSMAPTPLSQPIQVTAANTATATVTYAAAPLALNLQQVATGLAMPVFLTSPPGDINRQFIVERPGRIRIIENGTLLPTPFLDISNLTSTEGERGLLSMAFHPQYTGNGYFFIFYSNLAGDIVIERRQVSPGNRNLADPQSALQFMTIPHPNYANHYGGQVSFGPEGYLYISVGDGGGVGDPNGYADRTQNLLGKLLRINVDLSGPTLPYRNPSDNPFNRPHSILNGNRPEIWSYGLRNPWRYAFDSLSGLIYIADVGQDRREEINVSLITTPSISYGWNTMEGTLCYSTTPCANPGLILPVVEYSHDNNITGGCAVVGGYVYRGGAIPELTGQYLYSDYCGGWLKSFSYSNGVASAIKDWGITNVGNILSFGQDGRNDLYMLSATGTVYRIVRK